jgi:hypothetical protein
MIATCCDSLFCQKNGENESAKNIAKFQLNVFPGPMQVQNGEFPKVLIIRQAVYADLSIPQFTKAANLTVYVLPARPELSSVFSTISVFSAECGVAVNWTILAGDSFPEPAILIVLVWNF